MPRLFIHIIFLFIAILSCAQEIETYDENDENIRLHPDLGISATNESLSSYPFIRYDLNTIRLNGDDWSALSDKLKQSKTTSSFTVVHIGDSHIQADGNTGTTRKLMQSRYGDAGRGVIIPFKLAGTNEPRDYIITSPSHFLKATLMRQPWQIKMGFTGVSLQPESPDFEFRISSKSSCEYFTILCDGNIDVTGLTVDGKPAQFETETVENGLDVSMETGGKEIEIKLHGTDVYIFGFDLRNDNPGVIYHAIGNNGAAYSSYNSINDFGSAIGKLEPDLVIVSLGTNEAFGRLNDEAFTAQIQSMVRKIKKGAPETKILLTTPSECQKSVYTTVRRGKRRRARRTRSYQVNTNVARARQLILDYGKNNNIPVYDFYAVAGGEGSSTKWLNDRLLSGDRIHRTWQGYYLDGNLMYEALMQQLAN